MTKTCIIAFARNEEDIISEWITHHLNIGFNHIFILDNNDEDKPLKINNDNVTILPYHVDCSKIYAETNKNHTEVQVEAYNSILKYVYNIGYEYCAVIDIDEFIIFNSIYTNINDFIQSEMIDKSINMCELYWEIYNDKNIIWEKDCKNSIIKTYTSKLSDKLSIKTELFDRYTWSKCIIKLFPYTRFDAKMDWDFTNKEKILNGSGNVHWPAKELIENNTYTHNFIDKSIAVINHYRTQCLERFVTHKILNQNFNHLFKNVISVYFNYNEITEEKIEAFKFLFDKYGIEVPQNIDTLYKRKGKINEYIHPKRKLELLKRLI